LINSLSLKFFHPSLGDKIAKKKPDHDRQRHEDDLRHGDLPEEDSEDDLLSVLDEDDDQKDQQNQDNQDFCFHFTLLFSVDFIITGGEKASPASSGEEAGRLKIGLSSVGSCSDPGGFFSAE